MTETKPKDIELINRFTKKDLSEEEVFIFNITLCDNDVDRDFEAFSESSLNELCKLFEGKTGIADHSMRSKDQRARIFKTYIEKDPKRKTLSSKPYVALKASAYMMRTPENENLIAEIEGGIKKEVSVSCNAEKVVCSVCGKDMRRHECKHRKGQLYSGKLCFGILENTTDAYEWSFVAVPAQRNAGVTKAFRKEAEADFQKSFDVIKRITKDTIITRDDANEISNYIEMLQKKAQEAEILKNQIIKEIQKNIRLALPKVNSSEFSKGCFAMSAEELLCFKSTLQKQVDEIIPPSIQLKPIQTKPKADNSAFRI